MPQKSELEKIYDQVRALGDVDLNVLLNFVSEENVRRERKYREEDWNTVRSAIAKYIDKWGTIQVYDDEHSVDITYRSDFGSIGEIDATY